ncbi:uncharacterized protein G2W53_008710 [Senna tora]|uniref:Uncharacterized protein n=1 Tax=Senna tora TaxID=362788 RepID=A0A834X9E5_9FABA|nr:uncharacterized protein G2W53_008710 [Senna tora]
MVVAAVRIETKAKKAAAVDSGGRSERENQKSSLESEREGKKKAGEISNLIRATTMKYRDKFSTPEHPSLPSTILQMRSK